MAVALTYEEISSRIANTRDKSYRLITPSTEKILSRTRIKIEHNCGEIVETNFQAFVNDGKARCTKCYPVVFKSIEENRKNLVTEDEFIKRLNSKFNGKVVYVSGFVSTRANVIVKHAECGEKYSTSAKELLSSVSKTHGCRKCANSKSRGKYVQVENYLDTLIVEGYEWKEEYKGDNKILHKVKHLTCGTEYMVRPNDFQQGYRCPTCSLRTLIAESRNHIRIEKYLKLYLIPFEKEVCDVRNKSTKGGQLRFDFRLTNRKGKFIVIEYDGHFHSGLSIKSPSKFTDRVIKNTLRCDKEKDKFVKKCKDYKAIYRITHDQPVKKTLLKILKAEHFL